MSKNKLTAVEKLAIVQEIENGHIGMNTAVRKFVQPIYPNEVAKSLPAVWYGRFGDSNSQS